MNRFFLCLWLISPYLVASAQTKPMDKAIVNYAYSLYLPKDYSSTKRSYPLVIYLHGGSQRGNDLTKLNEYGPPQLVHQGQQFRFTKLVKEGHEIQYLYQEKKLYRWLLKQHR